MVQTPSGADARATIELGITELIVADRVRVYAFPAVALKLAEVLKSPTVDAAQVARVVAADPALAGAVLGLANSAAYGGGGEVTALRDAVARVGLDAVERVAVAAGLGEQACARGPMQTLRVLVWRWSVTSALVCQHLARHRHLDPGQAFLVGLLRSFGRSVCLSAIEQVLEAHRAPIALAPDDWLAVVEARQALLGPIVARRWSLPPLIHAVLLDEPPPDPTHGAFVTAARVADLVVALAERSATVSAEDLALLPGTESDAEREYLAAYMPRLPAAIHALIAAPPPKTRPQRPSQPVVDPETTLRGARRAIDLPVLEVSAKRRVAYRAVHAADDGIVLTGPQPLQTNSVVSVELGADPQPLRVWVRVTRCETRGSTTTLEVQPFALGRSDRQRWDALVGAPA